MEELKGDWWILKGQNCGQDSTWNGAYDAYPCQLQNFAQLDDGSWIRNTTFCTGKNNVCTSQYLNAQQTATLESPGTVLTEYKDPLYLSMVERWFIVERVQEDWMFYFWCSDNLAATDNGTVILGRARTLAAMPASVESRMRELTAAYGLDFDAMCVNDNSQCPFGSN